ncbi:hypothetical protein [Geobacter argillaceus]|uniref:hypothetical protein n=1 Tax=Geobacter argillaceus TaxID=345631 RepID=UPI0011A7202C|nr:hypothetical protein [Geobacter argillaceus]
MNNHDIKLELLKRVYNDAVTQRKIIGSNLKNDINLDTQQVIAEINDILNHASTISDFGATVTPMAGFSGILGYVARFTGEIILYFLSFMTDRQRQFNVEILNALNEINMLLSNINNKQVVLTSEVEIKINDIYQEVQLIKKQLESHKR